MKQNVFKPFETADYPAYWLGDDGSLLMNAAALAADVPLSDSEAMRRMLYTALREIEQGDKCGAHTMPLLTDALSMRTLTFMPTSGGMLAVAVDDQVAPVNAFSTQMREPLTNIFATLPLITSRLDDMDTQYTEAIQANCYQLLRLASNLENGSRVEKRLFDLQPVDVSALIKSLCYSADSVCHEAGVPIEWEVPDHPLPVRADPHLLSEAFLNQIRNSLQYTRDGNRIRVRLFEVSGRASLTVEDKGLGVKPEYVERIFEPYFSVDPYGDSNIRPGLGLGLAVVQQTICGFGGSVQAESRFGEGTLIHTSVPVDKTDKDMLDSDSADYLLNRFSPVYVQLCGYCRLPNL